MNGVLVDLQKVGHRLFRAEFNDSAVKGNVMQQVSMTMLLLSRKRALGEMNKSYGHAPNF